MPQQEDIHLARKLVECFNKNDPNNLNHFDEIIATDVQYHGLSYPLKTHNLQNFKSAEQEYIKAFPNKKTKIDSILQTEDGQVLVRWTTTATHKGNFHGNAPTNKDITFCGLSIWRFSNNKLVEAWQIWDRLGLFEQIGAIHITHASR